MFKAISYNLIFSIKLFPWSETLANCTFWPFMRKITYLSVFDCDVIVLLLCLIIALYPSFSHTEIPSIKKKKSKPKLRSKVEKRGKFSWIKEVPNDWHYLCLEIYKLQFQFLNKFYNFFSHSNSSKLCISFIHVKLRSIRSFEYDIIVINRWNLSRIAQTSRLSFIFLRSNILNSQKIIVKLKLKEK